MAMSSTTANWHWKTKHVSGWAREWFTSELCTLVDTQGEDTVKVSRVTEVEGDVELGQRKSKLITIYDCRVVLEWNATGKDETDIRGTLTIPEVSHENTLDGVSDYQYEWSMTASSGEHSSVNALFVHVKKTLPTLLEEKFTLFPKALLETHGRDLTVVVGDSANASGTSTPIPKAAVPPTAAASNNASTGSAPGKQTTKKTAIINTATVKVSSRFMASAEDLFSLLTDEKRIPVWSKAPAKSTPTVGSAFSLFSNGVTGEYLELDSPKKIVQKWKLASGGWPDDHFAKLTTTFTQDSDSTTVELILDGVPRGKEEEVERGLEGYYIRGLKSIGYVEVSLYTPSIPSSSSSVSRDPKQQLEFRKIGEEKPSWSTYAVLVVTVLVLVASVIPALLGTKPPATRQ